MNIVIDEVNPLSTENILPFVMYLSANKNIISDDTIKKLCDDSTCATDIFGSWESLVTQLGSLTGFSAISPIILIDLNMFDSKDTTLVEIINMIFTFTRCLTTPIKIKVGIVINSPCNNTLIKILQEAGVLGIVLI